MRIQRWLSSFLCHCTAQVSQGIWRPSWHCFWPPHPCSLLDIQAGSDSNYTQILTQMLTLTIILPSPWTWPSPYLDSDNDPDPDYIHLHSYVTLILNLTLILTLTFLQTVTLHSHLVLDLYSPCFWSRTQLYPRFDPYLAPLCSWFPQWTHE